MVGGVHPDVGGGFKGAVSIDMGAMDRVLEIDRTSRAARIQAGVYGPHLEEQLRPHGLTLRYYPQSFEYSTLGGWIVTRGAGHYATGLTHIDDMTESVRAVTPAGIHDSFRLPGSGAGPSPDRLFLGSEGALGIVTEAWMRLQDRPTLPRRPLGRVRAFHGRCGRPCARFRRRGSTPRIYACSTITRCAGRARETVRPRCWCWVSRAPTTRSTPGWNVRSNAAGNHGGRLPEERGGGGSAAARWRDAFIKGGHMREMLTARAIIRETFETAITWDRFEAFHRDVAGAAERALEEATGRPGIVACRFTHVYPDGPAPYFTFIGLGEQGRLSAQYDTVKNAVSDAIVDAGGTITHHHAVGRDHMPWYERQRSDVFASALKGAKAALDPAGIMNPGVLLPAP